MGVCVPTAGSSRNDPTGTLGSGDAVADDGVALGEALAIGRSREPDGDGAGVAGDGMSVAVADESGSIVAPADAVARAPSVEGPASGDALSGEGDGAARIVTARVSSAGLSAGRTVLPRIWSPSQEEKTEA